jgi:protein polybromo-1
MDGDETSESSTTTEKDRQDDSGSDLGPLGVQLEELFTAIMTATDSDGRVLNTVFQLLPSKKSYPEYYEVIESPIDLKMIATKIQSGEKELKEVSMRCESIHNNF